MFAAGHRHPRACLLSCSLAFPSLVLLPPTPPCGREAVPLQWAHALSSPGLCHPGRLSLWAPCLWRRFGPAVQPQPTAPGSLQCRAVPCGLLGQAECASGTDTALRWLFVSQSQNFRPDFGPDSWRSVTGPGGCYLDPSIFPPDVATVAILGVCPVFAAAELCGRHQNATERSPPTVLLPAPQDTAALSRVLL